MCSSINNPPSLSTPRPPGERPHLQTGLGVFEDLRCNLASLAVLRDGERELFIENTIDEDLRTIDRCVSLMTTVKDLAREV
jgi:hypothetical protein